MICDGCKKDIANVGPFSDKGKFIGNLCGGCKCRRVLNDPVRHARLQRDIAAMWRAINDDAPKGKA